MSLKKTFFILISVSILPVLLAWTFYAARDYLPLKTLNYGNIIQPPLKLPASKKWQIIYLTDDCDSTTQQTVFTLHQLKKALGKDSERIELVLAKKTNCPTLNTYDFKNWRLTQPSLVKWNTLFATKSKENAAHKIYLVDPVGNLFMYYPDSVNMMHVLKDLKRVLEVSQIG